MKDNLKEYLSYIDNLSSKEKIADLEKVIESHLIQIKFFQHERLIHLIVTVFVGSMTILFLLFGLLTSNIMLFILFAETLILFIPYIFYYYFLENGVQKLYKQYWTLLDKEKK